MEEKKYGHGVYIMEVPVNNIQDEIYTLMQEDLKRLREKPTVLTAEEIIKAHGNVAFWPEVENGAGEKFLLPPCCALMGTEGIPTELLGIAGGLRMKTEGYGTSWRLWSAKPTDEQRKAAPWREA